MTKAYLACDERTNASIHEAAHAVVFAFGGFDIGEIELFTNPEASGMTAHYLLASNKYAGAIEWSTIKNEYVPTFAGQLWQSCWSKEEAAKERRKFRALIVGMLAGPVASAVARGDGAIWFPKGYATDQAMACGLSKYLPRHSNGEEIANAWKVASLILGNPAVWAMVRELADAISRRGKIEAKDVLDYLPFQKIFGHLRPVPRHFRVCRIGNICPTQAIDTLKPGRPAFLVSHRKPPLRPQILALLAQENPVLNQRLVAHLHLQATTQQIRRQRHAPGSAS